MQEVHHFSESVKIEEANKNDANEFYITQLGATQIERFNDFKVIGGYQKRDIDLRFMMNGQPWLVSEKKRTDDYPDLLWEVYSSYPNTVGWGAITEAEVMTYFFPKSFYFINDLQRLRSFYLTELRPKIPVSWYDEIYNAPYSRFKPHDLEGYKVNVIKAPNEEGNVWDTISITLEWRMLKDNGIKFECIDLAINPKRFF